MKVSCNSKINGEEVKEIIDKKLNLLQDYRRDTELVNKKYTEMTNQFRGGIPSTTQTQLLNL